MVREVLRVAWPLFKDDRELEYDDRVRRMMGYTKSYLCKTLKFKTTKSGLKVVEFDLSLCVEVSPSISLKEAKQKGFRFVIDVLEA